MKQVLPSIKNKLHLEIPGVYHMYILQLWENLCQVRVNLHSYQLPLKSIKDVPKIRHQTNIRHG